MNKNMSLIQLTSLETIENLPEKTDLIKILVNQDKITEILYSLTPRQRIVWILYKVEGYNQVETAKIINRSRRLVVQELNKIKTIFAQYSY